MAKKRKVGKKVTRKFGGKQTVTSTKRGNGNGRGKSKMGRPRA